MASQNIKDVKILQECLMRIFFKDTSQLVSYCKALGRSENLPLCLTRGLKIYALKMRESTKQVNDERFTGQ